MKNLFLSLSVLATLFLGAACNNEEAATEQATETAAEQPVSDQPAASTSVPADGQTTAIPGAVQPQAPAGPTTKMTFKYLEYDFGTVKDGKVVSHEYEFTNTGTEPLIISDAKASCGCTVPSWPKEPIQPGGKGSIKVQFDSKGKPGQQSKKVTITANTDPSPIFLTIKGNVEAK